MKYVLIKPGSDGEIRFFKRKASEYALETTEFLSKAHVFEYNADVMQHILDRMYELSEYSAIPIDDIDIFKAKLADV
jgi:hypothetical protein